MPTRRRLPAGGAAAVLLGAALGLLQILQVTGQNYQQNVIRGESCNIKTWQQWALKSEMRKYEDLCRVALNKLRLDIAGGHGPVKEEDVYEVMCSPECTLNDALHEQIMSDSKCTCRQLSETYSNLEADFCSANSARMLCKQYRPLHAMGTRVMGTEDNLWRDKPGLLVQFEQVSPGREYDENTAPKFGYIDAVRINNWNQGQMSSKGSLEVCGAWSCPLDDFMCPRYEWNRKWICDGASALGVSRAVLLVAMLAHGVARLLFA
eukprot:g1628.t1